MDDLGSARANDHFSRFAAMLKARGHSVDRVGIKLLDFGCGGGELVKSAYLRGIDAYGCDISFDSDWSNEATLIELKATNRMRLTMGTASGNVSPTSGKPYRLPFEDATFDVVVSDQVFEHVRNYPEAIAELHRVMKPGAAMLHLFPPRYRPIEPHLFVPFGAFFRPRWWLQLWARLGLRNEFQRHMSVAEVVADNERFLSTMVNYLVPAEVNAAFRRGFMLSNAEADFMRVGRRAKLFVFPWAYRLLWCRCLFAVKCG
jgi:SAM-dependent methyltransferase